MDMGSQNLFKARQIAEHLQNGYLYDRLTAQKLLSLISVLMPLGLLIVYLIAPQASDSGSASILIMISGIVIIVASFRLFKNWKTPKGDGYQLFGAFLDFLATAAILIGYALTYDVPISIALKSPTANVFFIYLASRIVLFHGPIIIQTGFMAIATWVGLIWLSHIEPQFAGRTSSYLEYLTSFKVLLGAEVERLLQFAIITAVLYVFVYTTRRDPPTGYLRRSVFLQTISKFLSVSRRKKRQNTHALIEVRAIDISNTDKIYNQIFKLVPRLPSLQDIYVLKIGRLSFQSVGIWVKYPNHPKTLHTLVEKLHAELLQDATLTLSTEVPGLVMGASEFDLGATSEGQLTFTDIAIREALKAGKKAMVFDDAIRAKLMHITGIENTIKYGLEAKKFDVFYQPIVDLMTEKPVGFEALIRLKDKDQNYVSPDVFIPVAESTGLINDIMDYLCDQVMTDASHISDIFHTQKNKPYININVATTQLKDMPRTLNALLRARKGGLVINAEITESSTLNEESADDRIQNLQDAGFSVAIDDFGTGYSSIERLHQLSFSTLKIDQSFVKEIQDPEAYTFLAAIVNLARTTSNYVIQEGVETLEQKLLIMQMGVRYCQGYYYSRPMDIASLETYLAESFNLKKTTQNRAGHMGYF